MPRHKKRQIAKLQMRSKLQPNTNKPRTNSVPGPSAENAREQQAADCRLTLDEVVGRAREAIKRTSRPLYYCFVLQLEYSLRISEVLGIQVEDISANGGVLIKVKKGGNNKHIFSHTCAEFLIQAKQAGVAPFRDLNDTYVRRQYRKVGLVYHAPGREKDAVTHAFRHIAAEQIRSQGLGNEVVTEKLNHKSKKTQEWYGR